MRVRPYFNRSLTGRVRVADQDGNLHTIYDLTGQVYGELFVVRFLRVNEFRAAVFLCICSCLKHVEVTGGALRAEHNNTFSCGHIRREFASQRGSKAPAFKHGHATAETIKNYYATWTRPQMLKQNQKAA